MPPAGCVTTLTGKTLAVFEAGLGYQPMPPAGFVTTLTGKTLAVFEAELGWNPCHRQVA